MLLALLLLLFDLAACGILVPQPGIEPRPSAVKAWSPNHWTAKEFPSFIIFLNKRLYI